MSLSGLYHQPQPTVTTTVTTVMLTTSLISVLTDKTVQNEEYYYDDVGHTNELSQTTCPPCTSPPCIIPKCPTCRPCPRPTKTPCPKCTTAVPAPCRCPTCYTRTVLKTTTVEVKNDDRHCMSTDEFTEAVVKGRMEGYRACVIATMSRMALGTTTVTTTMSTTSTTTQETTTTSFLPTVTSTHFDIYHRLIQAHQMGYNDCLQLVSKANARQSTSTTVRETTTTSSSTTTTTMETTTPRLYRCHPDQLVCKNESESEILCPVAEDLTDQSLCRYTLIWFTLFVVSALALVATLLGWFAYRLVHMYRLNSVLEEPLLIRFKDWFRVKRTVESRLYYKTGWLMGK